MDSASKSRGQTPLPERFGRYRIIDRLASGGMANLYLGRFTGPDGFEKLVAVKQIHEHLTTQASFVKMFKDEARLAARIAHPNVAQVLELGQVGNSYYICMEYVEGENLTDLIKRTPVPVPMAARILADALAGLHAAHELRNTHGELLHVVHRDLSPSNILISYEGNVKVVDFGVAKARDNIHSTDAGMVKGKFAYMSPEQVNDNAVDRRSDVFAVGILLFEATTRRNLFKADTPAATVTKITGGEVPPPSKVVPNYPKELEEIVLRALQVDPAKRFQTAQEMQDVLEEFIFASGSPVTPAMVGEMMRKVFADRLKMKKAMLRARTVPGVAPPREPVEVVVTPLTPDSDEQPRPASPPPPPAPPAPASAKTDADAARPPTLPKVSGQPKPPAAAPAAPAAKPATLPRPTAKGPGVPKLSSLLKPKAKPADTAKPTDTEPADTAKPKPADSKPASAAAKPPAWPKPEPPVPPPVPADAVEPAPDDAMEPAAAAAAAPAAVTPTAAEPDAPISLKATPAPDAAAATPAPLPPIPGLTGEPVAADGTGPLMRPAQGPDGEDIADMLGRDYKRRQLLVIGGGAALALLLVLGGVWIFSGESEPTGGASGTGTGSAAPRKIQIAIRARPETATIRFDGKRVSNPFRTSRSAGRGSARVVVTAEGFKRSELKVDLARGGTFNVELQPAARPPDTGPPDAPPPPDTATPAAPDTAAAPVANRPQPKVRPKPPGKRPRPKTKKPKNLFGNPY